MAGARARETAERYGLVTGLHAPDDLRPAAVALAERIASRAPLSIEATKRTSSRAVDLSPDEFDAMAGPELRRLRGSHDHKAAIAAFRERREPTFTRS